MKPLGGHTQSASQGAQAQAMTLFLNDILVVDDAAGMTETLCELLRLKGYRAAAAHDGHEAVAKAGDLRPRVVLLDIRMPGLNGVETLRRLKRILPPSTVYVMMTAYAVDDLRREAMAEGALTVLDKPFEINEVIQIIEYARKHYSSTNAAPYKTK